MSPERDQAERHAQPGLLVSSTATIDRIHGPVIPGRVSVPGGRLVHNPGGCARTCGGSVLLSVFPSLRSRPGDQQPGCPSQSFQKSHQLRDFFRRKHQAPRMLFLLEDLLQRPGSAVVQERISAAHSPQRRRVELAIAHLVSQPDVVLCQVTCIRAKAWHTRALSFVENQPAHRRSQANPLCQRLSRLATAATASRDRPSGRRSANRLSLVPCIVVAIDLANLVFQSRHRTGPGPRPGRGHAQQRRHSLGRAVRAVTERVDSPGCSCVRRCGSYGSSSSRRAKAWRYRTAARLAGRQSARAAARARSSPCACPT